MNKEESIAFLRNATRSIPDYPKPGIMFRDLTTIFQDGEAFSLALDGLVSSIHETLGERGFDKFVGIEARGFVLAGALAARMGGGVVLLRKPGKLPYEKRSVKYTLEYGEDALEIHSDAIKPGERVIIVDDLLATGGTAEAAIRLVEELRGRVEEALFLVELPELDGRSRLLPHRVVSLISFDGH